MIQIKKTILTLALLLTAVTGAWAAQVELKLGAKIKNGDVLTFGSTRVHFTTPCSLFYAIFSAVNTSTNVAIGYDENGQLGYMINDTYIAFKPLLDLSRGQDSYFAGEGESLGLNTGQTIPEYVMVTDGTGTYADPFILTPYATYICDGLPVDGKAICDAAAPSGTTVTFTASDLADGSSITKDGVTLTAYGEYHINMNGVNGPGEFTNSLGGNFTKIVVTADNLPSGDGWSAGTWTGSASSVSFTGNIESWKTEFSIVCTLETASSSVEVAWDAAEKTGQFTMPGGNVELEPEYYPQATVADGGVTAADADARATTDDPLVKVDATKLTGAKKLMYFVSNSGTTAPAYDAEGWTDQLPTAEGFTQQGIVYVWYYPVGTDEGVDGATATYSDGDICLQSITARIAAAPTYAVTFAEGTNPEPPAEPEWTASPNANVTKGQTVTVTYTGTKKVLGVKAEKKAAAAAEGKTYTNLQGGEVLHVGDKITETYGRFRSTHHENPTSTDYNTFMFSNRTYEVLRADVAYHDYKYEYTESPNGQYYLLKSTYYDNEEEEWVTSYYFTQGLPVTGTSDGITVTFDGQNGSQLNLYTFWVHEPNP